MGEVATSLLSKTEMGMSGIFLALFLLVFWTSRQDAKSHKEELKILAEALLLVVEKNTESNTKLSDSILNLKERIT